MTKQQRTDLALQHHQEMLQLPKPVNIIYNGLERDYSDPLFHTETEIQITDNDTVSEIMNQTYTKNNIVCALNFASFLHPGGGFLTGAIAQEEALCHESNLYEALSEERDFYNYNQQHKNNGAYENRAIFSREVTFNDNHKADIITCACPNLRPFKMYGKEFTFNNYDVLKSRIQFILDVAEEECVNTLILGAWGCGVFMQDPSEVASIFKEVLQDDYYNFDKVIFAIPPGENNLKFKEIFQS